MNEIANDLVVHFFISNPLKYRLPQCEMPTELVVSDYFFQQSQRLEVGGELYYNTLRNFNSRVILFYCRQLMRVIYDFHLLLSNSVFCNGFLCHEVSGDLRLKRS